MPDITVEIVKLPQMRIASLRGTLGDAQAQWGRTMELAASVLAEGDVSRASILRAEDVAGGGVGAGTQYETAVILPAGVEAPSGLRAGDIPGGRYARARYVGGYEGLGAAWGTFVGEWLPSSGERVSSDAGAVAFEIYLDDGPPAVTELHIPLA